MNDHLADMLYRARHSAYGIIVRSTDARQTLRQLRYQRQALRDDALRPLRVTTSPDAQDELWIYRNTPNTNEPSDE